MWGLQMFNWLKSSTLNFMLSFINVVFAISLNSPLNGVIGVFCFLMAMAMRTEERNNVHKEDKES